MPSQDLPKICPQCKKTDVTSFKKCRWCSTPYDAVIEKKSSGVDQTFILIFSVVALAVIGCFAMAHQIKSQKEQQLVPLAKTIKDSSHPRVIEFYADWCGPCHSYGPTVEACQAKYAGKIDFMRLNVDKPENQELAKALEVSSIPKTCLFDKDGKEVEEFVGMRSPEELDAHVDKLLH